MSAAEKHVDGVEQASGAVPVRLSDLRLEPDPMRTALRPFAPGEPSETFAHAEPRGRRIVERALAISGSALDAEIARHADRLHGRHRDPERVSLARFEQVAADFPVARSGTDAQRRLIGAYLVQEFAFESTALFNPSVVRHSDQDGMTDGDTRVVVSLRGVGEGHVSSLALRTGVWRTDRSVEIDAASRFAVGPTI